MDDMFEVYKLEMKIFFLIVSLVLLVYVSWSRNFG